MEQTSVNKQQRRLLIGGWHDPQITSFEPNCLTKGFTQRTCVHSDFACVRTPDSSALPASREYCRYHVCRSTFMFDKYWCARSPRTPSRVWVHPLWVPKCSSRAGFCTVHQKPLQKHGQHTSWAAIVAVHSRGAGTFSHWDAWEHEPKLRSVFSVLDEARTVPTRNFLFKDRPFALAVPAMLAAFFFYLPLNFLQQSSSNLLKINSGLVCHLLL